MIAQLPNRFPDGFSPDRFRSQVTPLGVFFTNSKDSSDLIYQNGYGGCFISGRVDDGIVFAAYKADLHAKYCWSASGMPIKRHILISLDSMHPHDIIRPQKSLLVSDQRCLARVENGSIVSQPDSSPFSPGHRYLLLEKGALFQTKTFNKESLPTAKSLAAAHSDSIILINKSEFKVTIFKPLVLPELNPIVTLDLGDD